MKTNWWNRNYIHWVGLKVTFPVFYDYQPRIPSVIVNYSHEFPFVVFLWLASDQGRCKKIITGQFHTCCPYNVLTFTYSMCIYVETSSRIKHIVGVVEQDFQVRGLAHKIEEKKKYTKIVCSVPMLSTRTSNCSSWPLF